MHSFFIVKLESETGGQDQARPKRMCVSAGIKDRCMAMRVAEAAHSAAGSQHGSSESEDTEGPTGAGFGGLFELSSVR